MVLRIDGGVHRPTPSTGNQPHTASQAPRRAVEAPVRSSHAGSADATERAARSNQNRLEAAATRTQQAASNAARAQHQLESLQRLTPQQQRTLQGEVNDARAQVQSAKREVHQAVQQEIEVARELLSPAHFENYINAIERDFDAQPDEQDIVRAALARIASTDDAPHSASDQGWRYLSQAVRQRIEGQTPANLDGVNAGVSADDVAAAAFEYAPVFYFHPDEKYLPADPDTFIANSELEDGIWDLKDGEKYRQGDPANSPVTYQYEEGPPPTITYWQFYNYNNKAINNSPDQNHEGDWESVTVVFGNGMDKEPTEMRYSAHGGGTALSWNDTPKTEDGRPIVNVALGSHAMSPYLANQPTKAPGIEDVFAVGGMVIDGRGTDSNGEPRLQNVEDQAWWGTRNKWGEDGYFSFTSGINGPMPPDASGRNGKGAVGPTDKKPHASAADAMADAAVADPKGSRDDILEYIDLLENDDVFKDQTDEVAQDFVEVLDRRGQLDNYASTSEGREVLIEMARQLENGKTHDDEVASYEKIQAVLEPYGIDLKDIAEDA